MMYDPVFDAVPNIQGGFFGRTGGVSQGAYAGLNCDPRTHGHEQDNLPYVNENLDIACRTIGSAADSLIMVDQVHGAECLIAGIEDLARRDSAMMIGKADALVTTQRGVTLGILTADCVPVLLLGARENSQPVIGALHAGWRGAFDGIVRSTITAMKAAPHTIKAAIGPSIQQSSYEVSAEFQERFLRRDKSFAVFFTAVNGKILFDLPAFVKKELQEQNVDDIEMSAHDTYSAPDRFFSHRFATHHDNGITGRQISLISLK